MPRICSICTNLKKDETDSVLVNGTVEELKLALKGD